MTPVVVPVVVHGDVAVRERRVVVEVLAYDACAGRGIDVAGVVVLQESGVGGRIGRLVVLEVVVGERLRHRIHAGVATDASVRGTRARRRRGCATRPDGFDRGRATCRAPVPCRGTCGSACVNRNIARLVPSMKKAFDAAREVSTPAVADDGTPVKRALRNGADEARLQIGRLCFGAS